MFSTYGESVQAPSSSKLQPDIFSPNRGANFSVDAWADVVVAFDDLPERPEGPVVLDWRDTPSLNDRYAEAKAVIERRVGLLLGQVSAGCIGARTCH